MARARKLRGVGLQGSSTVWLHCEHVEIIKTQFKKIFRENIFCQYWESFELQKQENEHKIEEHLKLIRQRLDKVIQVLDSIKRNEFD